MVRFSCIVPHCKAPAKCFLITIMQQFKYLTIEHCVSKLCEIKNDGYETHGRQFIQTPHCWTRNNCRLLQRRDSIVVASRGVEHTLLRGAHVLHTTCRQDTDGSISPEILEFHFLVRLSIVRGSTGERGNGERLLRRKYHSNAASTRAWSRRQL